MDNNKQITVYINDLPEHVSADSSLETLIQQYDERDPDLVVELNGRFIYPRDYATTLVKQGDEIEFMNPDFGG